MGKKRAKDRSPREDDSMDLSGVTCTHVRKGIDRSLLKKTGLDKHWDTCQVCLKERGSNRDAASEKKTVQESPAVWMCLKCGHRGCGRSSEEKHAIKHYEKPHSEPHCIVLCLDNWSVWCYICDDNVYCSVTGQLAQLVSSIRKQVLADSDHKASARELEEESGDAAVGMAEKEQENVANQKERRKGSRQNGSLKEPATASTANAGTVAVRGLSNLGNTCFFNAVLQNLSQTRLLRQLLSDLRDEEGSLLLKPVQSSMLEPLQVRLPRPGALTLAMCHLLNEIQETKKAVVTPRELFTQVCKKAARFKGFQQQDSQELLRYLLDGMRAEENCRITAGILEALKGSGTCSDTEQKKLVKEYERNGVTKSFVDHVFGGEMTSTVMCKECKTVSLVTEVFLDLSLPVADEAYRKKNQKKGVQQRNSVCEDGGQDTPLVNGTEDMPTGAGSKYQQKKAKKQAKKQAKNQKRQQKQGAKMTLDCLTNQKTGSPLEVPPVGADGQVFADTEGGEDQLMTQSVITDPAEQEHDRPGEEEEEEENIHDNLSVQSTASTNGKCFSALSEERMCLDMPLEQKRGEEEEEEEEEKETCTGLCEETEELTEAVEALTLRATSEMERQGREALGDSLEYIVVNRDPELAFHALASRPVPDKQECSVESCLYQFTEVEHLTESNSLLCSTCTKRQTSHKASDGSKKNIYRDALKQMLISSPPPVLTLHLKRFQQVGYSVCKVNRHVQFPQVLDLAPFCSLICKGVEEGETQVLYSLYGIVEHSGTMRSGHYTAFVKTRPQTQTTLHNGTAAGETTPTKGCWFHISDSSVQPVTEAKVENSQAYLLFYERIS
ncbi:ubiquitin carboxyl-terminal hydrolase 16 [Electrophorus electricus]|uniref:ubiquitin carboxyl-terminal hydrolase 16 n=1 Tax=Electrophorus electricus TaxID=8005 RepID=UPI0015D0043C|nr:ubiquitin carboxyl-terminal hydrolase 16 [Electrophorus electricus]